MELPLVLSTLGGFWSRGDGDVPAALFCWHALRGSDDDASMYSLTSRSALVAFLRLRSGRGTLELATDEPGRLTVFSSISHPTTTSFHETRRRDLLEERGAEDDRDLDVDLLRESALDLLSVE